MTTQFALTAAPQDTVQVMAENVTDETGAAVTSGLTGTMTVYDRNTDAVVIATAPLTGHADSDWWGFIEAPDEGQYRVVVVLDASGKKLTLRGELQILDPLT